MSVHEIMEAMAHNVELNVGHGECHESMWVKPAQLGVGCNDMWLRHMF